MFVPWRWLRWDPGNRNGRSAAADLLLGVAVVADAGVLFGQVNRDVCVGMVPAAAEARGAGRGAGLLCGWMVLRAGVWWWVGV
ncbi:MAG: hypothetical protein N2557_07955 [Hydrogenophilus sp.]|nr:hypothetical protein [Hydrogenophilus sp.]